MAMCDSNHVQCGEGLVVIDRLGMKSAVIVFKGARMILTLVVAAATKLKIGGVIFAGNAQNVGRFFGLSMASTGTMADFTAHAHFDERPTFTI